MQARTNVPASSDLLFAIECAEEVGKLLMDNYGKIQQLEWKLKTNFKTQVDDESDRLIRQRIKAKYPNDTIWSEEADIHQGSSERVWVIDPLDGTLPYTYGVSDHFSVCIALVVEETPILGVVYAPKRNELYSAEQGQGSQCNGTRLQVSDLTDINRVLMDMGSGKFNRTSFLTYLEAFYAEDGITCAFAHGCASVPLCLVGSGKMHATFYTALEPWDMAACVPIIREAGGEVTNIAGEQWTLREPSIFAANPILHKNLTEFLKKKKGATDGKKTNAAW